MSSSNDQQATVAVATDLFGQPIIDDALASREELAAVFEAVLKGTTAEQLASFIYSPYDAVVDFCRLRNGEKAGERISLLFNAHRLSTRRYDKHDLVSGFAGGNSFFDGLARATLWRLGTTNQLLYAIMQTSVNQYAYVNEFPPYIARRYYKSVGARRVLDPCAGWGGRMIGAASIGAYYHGFEPATRTADGLERLGAFLKLFDTGFDFRIDRMPFEDATLTEQYDIALTSPPYFDTEWYSDEDTQSFRRYPTFGEWCERFYVPMIHTTMAHAPYFILNIANRHVPLSDVMLREFPTAQKLTSLLSGAVGLGREPDGHESFYLLSRAGCARAFRSDDEP